MHRPATGHYRNHYHCPDCRHRMHLGQRTFLGLLPRAMVVARHPLAASHSRSRRGTGTAGEAAANVNVTGDYTVSFEYDNDSGYITKIIIQ